MQGPANVDAIGLLVELGADLWSVMKDVDMETPLHMASRSGRLDIVEKLLRCGADLNKKTKASWLCAHHTVHFNAIGVLGCCAVMYLMRFSTQLMSNNNDITVWDCLLPRVYAPLSRAENSFHLITYSVQACSILQCYPSQHHSACLCRMAARHYIMLLPLGRLMCWRLWSRLALR